MRMNPVIFCSFLLLWVSSPDAANANVGEYRGYVAAQNLLADRLILAGRPFSFLSYTNNQFGLLNLLGYYEPNGENSFRNGQPNAVNTLVWQMVLQGFAEDVALHCQGKSPLVFQPLFHSTIGTLCRWPEPEAQEDATMRMLWLSVMGYDAPEEEYLAWREFFLRSSYASRPAQETLPVLIFSILYNPHFLLRK